MDENIHSTTLTNAFVQNRDWGTLCLTVLFRVYLMETEVALTIRQKNAQTLRFQVVDVNSRLKATFALHEHLKKNGHFL